MVNITKWKKKAMGWSVDLKLFSFIDLQNKAWLNPKGGGRWEMSWKLHLSK